jgi:non-ribosomal peptide synthetase component F
VSTPHRATAAHAQRSRGSCLPGPAPIAARDRDPIRSDMRRHMTARRIEIWRNKAPAAPVRRRTTTMTSMLKRYATYEEIHRNFTWNIPAEYNIADDVCERWADDPARLALIYADRDKRVHRYTFAEIRSYANQWANALRGLGLARGDRVTVLLA